MSSLGMLIREFQRDAAALPTDELRTEIEINLEVLDAAIGQFYSIRPGIGNMDDRISATGDVMVATLMTALYVRELATRPARPGRLPPASISPSENAEARRTVIPPGPAGASKAPQRTQPV